MCLWDVLAGDLHRIIQISRISIAEDIKKAERLPMSGQPKAINNSIRWSSWDSCQQMEL